MVIKRRHFTHTKTFEERLAEESRRFKEAADQLPPGTARDWPASAKWPDAPPVFNFDQPFPFGQLILDLTPHGPTAFIGDENAGCAPAIL